MHELSIAKALIDLASDQARAHGASRVTRIRVRLGVLAGVMRPLYFCFDAAAAGTACEGARLEIEEVPVTLWCPSCEDVGAPTAMYSFRCPSCGMPTSHVRSGREMQLVAIEVDERGDIPLSGEPDTHARSGDIVRAPNAKLEYTNEY